MALITYAALGGLALAAAAAAPFALPSKAHVERSVVIAAPPETIFKILSTSSGFDKINPFRDADPSLEITFSGPDVGIGASFAWTGKSGAGVQTIVETEIDRRVAMELDLGQMGKPVQTFTINATKGGSRVTWALDAELGANPIQRVFGLFMDRMLGSSYESGLGKLARVAVEA